VISDLLLEGARLVVLLSVNLGFFIILKETRLVTLKFFKNVPHMLY